MSTMTRILGTSLAAVSLLGLTGCSLLFHPADRIDADGDGYFAVGDMEELAGRTVEDMEVSRLDCDDNNDDVFPGAAELCDGLDNDCSRFFEGTDAGLSRNEQDQDGDGFSPCGFIEGDGVTDQEDCNDDPDAFGVMQSPAYEEVCGIPLAPTITSYNGPHPDRITTGLDDDCDPTTTESNEIDSDQDGHLRGCDRVSLEALHGLEEGEGSDHPNFALFDCVDDNDEVYPTTDEAESCVPGLESVWTSTCRNPANLTEAQRAALFETWYPDFDRDGDGNIEESTWETELCLGQRPDGFVPAEGEGDRANWINEDGLGVAQALDCDDLNPSLHRLDLDADSYFSCGTIADGSDQDFVPGGVDEFATAADLVDVAFPGGTESCDGYDNDLNGRIDEDFDVDVDLSYSDPQGGGVDGCSDTYGTSVDCDDTDPAQNTLDQDNDGATTCAGDCNDFNDTVSITDLDLDGFTTCAVPPDCDDTDPTLYPDDLDGDGFDACPVGATPADCNDSATDAAAPLTFPGNGVQCDGIADSNCDNVADPLETDADGDLYIECDDATATAIGGGLLGGNDCNDADINLTPADGDLDGFSTCTDDCDDTDATSYPAAPMLCDGVTDNDCNGVLDPNEADVDNDTNTPCAGDCDDFDATVEGLDVDNDGFTTCQDDCNDNDAGLNPGVDADGDGWDVCGAGLVPADCDDADAGENWNDADGDGASTCSTVPDCDDTDATQNQLDVDNDNETTCDGDCDDSDGNVNTTENESSNGVDDDCDGIADEGLVVSGDVAVVEMMIGTDASTGDAFGEYIEVLNDSGTGIDLRGWEVEVAVTGGGTSTFVFPSDSDPATALDFANNTRVVLARSNTTAAYGTDIADFTWSAAAFSNNGGTITLSAPTAAGGFTVIDTLTWTGSGCTVNCGGTQLNPTYGNAPANGAYWRPGFAMGLKPSVATGSDPAGDNNSMGNWCEEQTPLGTADHGSPGAAATTASLVGGSGC